MNPIVIEILGDPADIIRRNILAGRAIEKQADRICNLDVSLSIVAVFPLIESLRKINIISIERKVEENVRGYLYKNQSQIRLKTVEKRFAEVPSLRVVVQPL